MCSLWLLFLLGAIITVPNNGAIMCTTVGECVGKTINCTDTADCIITCTDNACLGTTFNCPDDYLCKITTGGANSARQVKIKGNSASSLEIISGSTGDFQLQEADITCPNGGSCSIHCDGNAYQVCHSAYIHAELASSFEITCENQRESCNSVDIWCPVNNLCELTGTPDTSAMTDLAVYSERGFYNITVNNGNIGISLGTMHCLPGYTANCMFDANPSGEPSNSICSPSDHVCNNAPAPTIAPTTTSPTTSTPTTDAPTTSVPTTSAPTTSFPTTSVPTTIQPTTITPTNVPTITPTSVPTTITPTTISPTTTVPTTVQPTSNPIQTTYTLLSFYTQDITLSIKYDDSMDLDTETIVNEIEDDLSDYYGDVDVQIISTSDGEIIILVTINGNEELESDTIESLVDTSVEDYLGENDIDGEVTISIVNDDPEVNPPPKSHSDLLLYIILGIVAALLIVIGIVLYFYAKKRNVSKDMHNQTEMAVKMESKETHQIIKNVDINNNDHEKINIPSQPALTKDGNTKDIDGVDDMSSSSDSSDDMYDTQTQTATKGDV